MRRRFNTQTKLIQGEMSKNSSSPRSDDNSFRTRFRNWLLKFGNNWLVPFWFWISGRSIRKLEVLQIELRDALKAKEESDAELQSEKDANDHLKQEKEDLLNRLSAIAGTKLKYNNPGLTDLSDDNRPSKLAEKFSELYDNEWTEAFENILQDVSDRDDLGPDTTVIKRLLQILKEVYSKCKTMAELQRRNIEAVATSPALQIKDIQNDEGSYPCVDRDSLKKKISDFQKDTSRCIISNIQQHFLENDDFIKSYNFEVKHCRSYIAQCIQLCWYMNIQEPPLLLDFSAEEGMTYDINAWRLYTKAGNVVDMLVWPAMFLCAKGPLLSKGVIQAKDEA